MLAYHTYLLLAVKLSDTKPVVHSLYLTGATCTVMLTCYTHLVLAVKTSHNRAICIETKNWLS